MNLLQDVVGGLELIGLLEIPTLPTELKLSEFGCPAP